MPQSILGLRTCIYKVPDMGAAKAWYAQVFETEPYFDEAFYVGFDIGGYELGLQPAELTSEAKAENVLAYWGVEDIQIQYDRLMSLGAAVHEEPMDVGGGVMVGTLKDPWGNILGLICNPHFGKGPEAA